MSLARNPNMPYVSAGRQDSPFERMNVRSNVYVPDADARADCDGRPAYQAPADARRQPFGISVKVFVILVAAALFILAMFYIRRRQARGHRQGRPAGIQRDPKPRS